MAEAGLAVEFDRAGNLIGRLPGSDPSVIEVWNGSHLDRHAVDLPSGAGHDAAIMATAGIPSAMLFARSDAGGVSHAPEESTGADAIVLCAQALESAPRELAA